MNNDTAIANKPTDREFYLAARPDIRDIQNKRVKKFNRLHEEVVSEMNDIADAKIRVINKMWAAGEEIGGLEETLPTKQLTLDFHIQLHGKGDLELHADFETIKKYKLVRNLLNGPIKTIEDVQQFTPVFNFFWEIEKKRDPQHRLPTLDAWNSISIWHQKINVHLIDEFASSPDYFLDGKIKPEAAETIKIYADEWRPKKNALERFWSLIGI